MTRHLKAYIGNRIRLLRLEKGMTQQELEEKADLPLKYAYKLERLEPNIKVDTLEKIMEALDATVETFFDMSLTPNNSQTSELLELLAELPPEKRNSITKHLIALLREMKN